jgi:GT2 family glycosyltransferase
LRDQDSQSDMNALRVAVIIPCFNEAQRIAEVVNTVPAFVERIIVVDDKSDDETLVVLSNIDNPRLLVLSHEHNQGVGGGDYGLPGSPEPGNTHLCENGR